jgi:signal transduction histidine kinase
MRLYRLMSRLPAPRSYIGKILLVSFIGVHIPMIVAVVYVLLSIELSVADTLDILIALLLATLGGTVATLLALYALLRPVDAAARSLRTYLEEGRVPALPLGYTDRAGVLMANVQEAVTRLDAALDTARRQRDEALRSKREKFELLAGMSHDLRTPLNHVIGFAELMSTEALGPLGHEAYRGYAKDIGSSGGDLLEVLQSVLDLSQAELDSAPLAQQPVCLADAVERALNLTRHQAERNGVGFSTGDSLDGGLAVLAEERTLKQILLQAFHGSMTGVAPGATIRVDAQPGEDVVTLSVACGQPWSAEDVPPELRAAAGSSTPAGASQEAFPSSNPTALRLSLVRSLARATGGELRVPEASDGGRCLLVELPRAAALQSAA